MSNIELEVKQLVIDVLHLEDISVDDIDRDQALFGEGLGLDSIDALELGVALKKRYGITLSSKDEKMKQHFASIASLAKLVEQYRGDDDGHK